MQQSNEANGMCGSRSYSGECAEPCVVRAYSGCGVYARGEAEAEARLVREHSSAQATKLAAARGSRGAARREGIQSGAGRA